MRRADSATILAATYSTDGMTPEQKIYENAALVIQKCQPISGLGTGFGYNRNSVEWLDGYIERLRADGDLANEQAENLTQIFACFLGESIRATYGGAWREQNGTWGVFFKDSTAAFPFSKVHKQITDGREGGDSILSFFDILPQILDGSLYREPPKGRRRTIWDQLLGR
jgi:hypothetical protein